MRLIVLIADNDVIASIVFVFDRNLLNWRCVHRFTVDLNLYSYVLNHRNRLDDTCSKLDDDLGASRKNYIFNPCETSHVNCRHVILLTCETKSLTRREGQIVISFSHNLQLYAIT